MSSGGLNRPHYTLGVGQKSVSSRREAPKQASRPRAFILTDVGASLRIIFRFGAVAQLAERVARIHEARGSNPLSSTFRLYPLARGHPPRVFSLWPVCDRTFRISSLPPFFEATTPAPCCSPWSAHCTREDPCVSFPARRQSAAACGKRLQRELSPSAPPPGEGHVQRLRGRTPSSS